MLAIKNASSYSTSFFVDDEAYRQIGHDSNDKCEYISAREKTGEGSRVYTRGQLCKVERRKWENIAGVPVMKEELLSDGRKRKSRERRKRERDRGGSAVSDHYLIRSAVSEMEPLINIIYDVNSAARYRFREICRSNIIALRETEFTFLLRQKLHGTREIDEKSSGRSSLPVLADLFFAIASKSCFRILRVYLVVVVVGNGFPSDKGKEKKRGKKKRTFTYVIHRVCYLITVFAPPCWPSPRRMTVHNGDTDIFKSAEGIRSLFRVTYPAVLIISRIRPLSRVTARVRATSRLSSLLFSLLSLFLFLSFLPFFSLPPLFFSFIKRRNFVRACAVR